MSQEIRTQGWYKSCVPRVWRNWAKLTLDEWWVGKMLSGLKNKRDGLPRTKASLKVIGGKTQEGFGMSSCMRLSCHHPQCPASAHGKQSQDGGTLLFPWSQGDLQNHPQHIDIDKQRTLTSKWIYHRVWTHLLFLSCLNGWGQILSCYLASGGSMF